VANIQNRTCIEQKKEEFASLQYFTSISIIGFLPYTVQVTKEEKKKYHTVRARSQKSYSKSIGY
jgi:hypothetical protein